ncbi:MAG: phosphatidate cytidylyltransferase, partial [Sedimentisphaerales bacterium]|nr:phosphatidate cytidylyltransferase [Sedimentisphaerales bacterium]
SCLSIIYLGVGGWFLMAIRLIGRSEPGTWGQIGPLVMFLACVKSCDIGAYFTGRFLGRHKMIPSISPGKTWEGLIGGVVLAVIAASLFACFVGIIGYGKSAVFGVAVAVSGQLGDLLESMLKRDAGSKDSASLVPEFGGVLDLLDSPLAAAPIAYMIFIWN